MKSVDLRVVASVHDRRDVTGTQDGDEAAEKLGRADATGKSSDHAARRYRGPEQPGSPRTVCKAQQVGPRSGEDRLVVALDATPLLGVPTGVGVFCREVIRALAARADIDSDSDPDNDPDVRPNVGLEIAAFAVTWRRRHLLDGLVPKGVRIVRTAMPARPLHLAWRHLEQPPVEWFVGPADVVHGTNFVVPPTKRAARIVTVHDLTTVRFPEMCDEPTLRYPQLIRRAVARGAWVHTPSQYVADEVVAEFGVDRERVRAVHHGTPSSASTGSSPTSSSTLTPTSEGTADQQQPGRFAGGLPVGTARYVIAVGTAEPRKDLPGLVRAFDAVADRLHDLALVLAGPPGWGSDALERAVDAARFRSRIVMTGYVPDIDHLLRGASVLAYPSLYEGFGLPTLEAMAAGVPVVTTTAGALPEVVGDAAVLVRPGDTDALAGALELVLTDETERCSLIERGYRRAAQFTWENCASGLADLYRDAAGSHR